MPRKAKPDLTDAFVKGGVKKTLSPAGGTEVQNERKPRPPERKKVSFAMRPDLHHRLKVAAAVHQREMSEILEEALSRRLDELDSA